MEFTFLGTSSGVPTRERNVSGLAIKSDVGKPWCLVDCGESTQHQLLRTSYSLIQLDVICITHVHGDHCYGLPGLLGSASMAGRTAPLTILAPAGIREFIQAAIRYTDVHLSYPVNFARVEDLVEAPGFAASGFEIQAYALSHRVPSYAYRFSETRIERQLDTAKLRTAGIEQGPLWGTIKRNKTLELADGRLLDCEEYLLPARHPRRVIVGGDNDTPELLERAVADAGVLIHESTYTQATGDQVGTGPQHSTAAQVARFAQTHTVPNLVLTHFSARYQASGRESVDVIASEAQSLYDGNLFLAEDLATYQLDTQNNLSLQPARLRA